MKICKDKIKLDVSDIWKIILILGGLAGGAITVGDRIYAPKEKVVVIETKVGNIDEKVDRMDKRITVIYNAFVEAARHARIDSTR